MSGWSETSVALRLLTVNGAALTFDESEKGPLVPGNLADLTVLREDPATIGVERQRQNPCLLTMTDGSIVHRT